MAEPRISNPAMRVRFPPPASREAGAERMPRPRKIELRRCRRPLVDAGLEHAAGRDLRQQLVGVALLVQRLVEELTRVREIELVGERAGRAVGGDLVVLDALRRRDERGVLDRRVAARRDRLLALGDQALHPFAFLLQRAADLPADLLEPADMVAR